MTDAISQPEQIALWDRRARMPDLQGLAPDPELLERVEATEGQHLQALDIGCGCGRHLLQLAKAGWRMTGVDCSAEALSVARKRLEQEQQVATLLKGDFRRLPVPGGHFALAIATNVLQHGWLSDFRRAALEIKRVLKPGGLAIISVPALSNAPPPHWGQWPEAGTIVLDRGAEAGLPHHFFTEAELRSTLAAFPRGLQIDLLRRHFPLGFEPYHREQRNDWFWISGRA